MIRTGETEGARSPKEPSSKRYRKIGSVRSVVPGKRCSGRWQVQVQLLKRDLNSFYNIFTRKLIILRPCSESIKKTLDVVNTMLELADEGDAVREDVGCGILYAVLRDSAYKIKKLAEAEREAHSQKGWWGE
jgi:hypothetical protein